MFAVILPTCAETQTCSAAKNKRETLLLPWTYDPSLQILIYWMCWDVLLTPEVWSQRRCWEKDNVKVKKQSEDVKRWLKVSSWFLFSIRQTSIHTTISTNQGYVYMDTFHTCRENMKDRTTHGLWHQVVVHAS